MYGDAIVLQRMQRFQPFQNSISSQKYEGYEPFSLENHFIELLLELCQESWDILIDQETVSSGKAKHHIFCCYVQLALKVTLP